MLQVSYEEAVVDQEFSKIVRVDRPLSLVRFGLVSLSTALCVNGSPSAWNRGAWSSGFLLSFWADVPHACNGAQPLDLQCD